MTHRVWVKATKQALLPLANVEYAAGMTRYMKDVAPYLGIRTPARRVALKAAWKSLPALNEFELAQFVQAMWELPAREFQYAATDAFDWHRGALSAEFLEDPVRHLVSTKPWWDTVDSLGSSIITPLVNTYPELVSTMWQWLESSDIWLARAAIQHQRGNKQDTDLELLFAMCEVHVTDREFWIAKAIGWALRDASAYWPSEVQAFVNEHPNIAPVARREAQRGIDRAL
ncbi:MAG: DNA alkylation repair protein [Actinomycetota bacterium]|nr:DNA alkylation repair protein [Actinomycetota bacterium]